MYELLYCSSARQDLTDDDITAILETSRQWNNNFNITGCLLYFDKQFIQIIEGERALVKQLFANIEKDNRHENVIVLKENEKENRFFVDWSMAFEQLTLSDMDNIDKVLSVHNFISYKALDFKLTKAMKLFCDLAKEPFRKLTEPVKNSY